MWFWGIDQAPKNTGIAVLSEEGEIAFTRHIKLPKMDSWAMREAIIELYKEKKSYTPGMVQCEHIFKGFRTSIKVFQELAVTITLIEEYITHHRTSLVYLIPATPVTINSRFGLYHKRTTGPTRQEEMARVVEETWGRNYGEHVNDALLLAKYALENYTG